MNFPAEIAAGLTFRAAIDLPDYPAGTWTLTAILRGPGQINLTATASGTTHVFEVSATDTGDLIPGDYVFQLRATNGSDVQLVSKGFTRVTPDLAGITTPHDGRSDNEKALAAIEAVISGRATIDQERYRINNRELWRTPIAELLRLQSFYKVRVRRERRKANGCSAFGRAVHVRFS